MSSPENHTARTVSDRWLAAVNSRDLDAVLSLYAPDSILLPTFSPHIIRNDERRREYFTRLAERPGLAVSLHEKTFTAQTAGNQEIASGIYCFHMEIDGEPYAFEARFTFVIDPQSVNPILHHHSSQIPRTLG
jgi:hypothetical protein